MSNFLNGRYGFVIFVVEVARRKIYLWFQICCDLNSAETSVRVGVCGGVCGARVEELEVGDSRAELHLPLVVAGENHWKSPRKVPGKTPRKTQ